MIIEFQYTYDEFDQANKAITARAAKKKSAANQWILAFWVVYGFAAVWIWDRLLPGSTVTNLFHVWMPFGTIIVAAVAATALVPLCGGRIPKVPWRMAFRLFSLIGMVLVIGVLYRFEHVIRPGTSQESWSWSLLLPHTTWIVLMFWLIWKGVKTRAKVQKDKWDNYPGLTRPKTVEITASGIVFKDAVSSAEYRWEAFVDFEETKTLFLFYTSPRTAQFVPKRAFTSEEQVNAMRALMELIPRQTNAAFPVQPSGEADQAAPLSATAK
jgi:hypothetical protein